MTQEALEKCRSLLDSSFDAAVFCDGKEQEILTAEIRSIYEAGESSGEAFAVTRAKILDHMLQNARIAVNDFELFAGVVERGYLNFRYGMGIIRTIQRERAERFAESTPQVHAENLHFARTGLGYSQVDLSHTSPDWDRVITLGIPGLLAEAEEKFRHDPCVFTESVLISCRAFRNFALRFSRVAGANGRKDLETLLKHNAERAPETLHEALQLSILYRHVQEIEGEWVRSMGIFDRQYAPFYFRDLESGRLTEDQALDLLIAYFAHFHAEAHGNDNGVPFCFGGRVPGRENSDLSSGFTRLAWKAFRMLGYPNPKFSLRWNRHTPEDLLQFAAECICENKSAMVIANEDLIRQTFLRHGKAPEDLDNFIPIGCYEPAIMGRELSCTMAGQFNFAKLGEMLFEDETFAPESFEEVEEKYFALLKQTLSRLLENSAVLEKSWYDINPAPMLSAAMKDCMEKLEDVSRGGTRYSPSGVMCAGLGTAVDILEAVKTIVFREKMLTFAELRKVLADNFKDHEELRIFARKRTPKWGCGNAEADQLGRKIVDFAGNLIRSTPNSRGGYFQMGLWSLDLCLGFGSKMGATADGRLAGETISKNCSAAIGCDIRGAAGSIESFCALDHTQAANGSILDIMLTPRMVSGKAGRDFLCSLIKSCFARGGMYIHFNVLSPEQLKAAQREPEKYRNLQIRLCGWNVRFVDLDKDRQDWLIREAESKE